MEQDDKHLNNRISEILTGLEIVNKGITRNSKYKDPVTRSIVMTERLILFTDVLSSVVLNVNKDFPEDVKDKIRATTELLNRELEFLLNWIQNPIYSPDHPIGNKMMKDVNSNNSTNSLS